MTSLCVHSNLGGNTINEVALDFWRAGRAREEISMEFLEQRLRLELQEPEGKSRACLQDVVGRLPTNLPLCAGLGPCLRSPIHRVLWNKPLFQLPSSTLAQPHEHSTAAAARHGRREL